MVVARATVRIRHRGCITERLPAGSTLSQVSGERGYDVFVLNAPDPRTLDEALRVAESNGERAIVLSRTEQTLVFKGGNPPGGIVEAIRESPCWILWPLVYRDGLEHYSLAAPTREDLRALVARLARHGDVKVERVSEEEAEGLGETIAAGDLVNGLTARQLEALRLASARGYYRSPKATSSEELAEEFGVSPSTMREHLRKAEAALVGRVATLLNERPTVAKRATRGAGRPPSR